MSTQETSSEWCAKETCPRRATFGTKCALHWMRFKAAGKELRKSKFWRQKYERPFAAGLDMRRFMQAEGYTLDPAELEFPPRFREKWTKLTNSLVADFDKGKQ